MIEENSVTISTAGEEISNSKGFEIETVKSDENMETQELSKPISSTDSSGNSSSASLSTTSLHKKYSHLIDEELIQEIHSIPNRMGFRIGEVAEMLGIKSHVLRYWEKEFDVLKANKAANNHRMYTRHELEMAFLVRKLLYRDRFSIQGAKSALKQLKAEVREQKKVDEQIRKLETQKNQIMKSVLAQAKELLHDVRKFSSSLP